MSMWLFPRAVLFMDRFKKLAQGSKMITTKTTNTNRQKRPTQTDKKQKESRKTRKGNQGDGMSVA